MTHRQQSIRKLWVFGFVLTCAAWLPVVAAQEESCVDGRCTTTYSAAYFTRYTPTSALDMIRNVPGYRLDDGDENTRGFGGAAGNVLIDGERISAKNSKPSDLLRRIPASEVAQIVVLRGQLGGLDLANQSLVANVVRKEGGTSGTWNLRANQYLPDSSVLPGGNFNLAGVLGALRYNASLNGGRYKGFVDTDEQVNNLAGELTEVRDEVFEELGSFYGASFNGQGEIGATAVSINLALSHFEEDGGEVSLRLPVNGLPFALAEGGEDGQDKWEMGFDLERSLSSVWQGKVIALHRSSDYQDRSSLDRRESGAAFETLVRTRFDSESSESIGRLELDYSGFTGHLVEVSMEAANNRLESAFGFAQRQGDDLVEIDVPGANSVVEEDRFDLTISDSFRIGGVSLDFAFGGEWSQITQRGDFSESRSFFYVKPSLLVSYPIDEYKQLRSSIRREVGQLDFFDFVSSADLGDDELELGNPSLVPERTTTFDLTYEMRAGTISSFSTTLFHDWIDDVEDVLPLQGVLEVPGNIGRGTRYGARMELTLPLDALLMPSARLDVEGRWQRSEVDDPLSQRVRDLSGEREWRGSITVRQDLTQRGFSWWVKAFAFDDEPQFGLDELDQRGRRIDIDLEMELSVTDAMRLQFGIENLLRDGPDRTRQVFSGPRNVAPLAFVERREQSYAREFYVRLKGVL
ncbi:MAG: TonB-dependent receptor [Pseudomonadota bacterium]